MRNRNTYAEPWRIKMVEPIAMTTAEHRARAIREAHYNLFNVASKDVYVDLLTDSGTSAMSDNQWSGIMIGDEAYAGSRSFHNLKESIKDIMGFDYVVPTHQGRAAENILMTMFLKEGMSVPGNMHFDTTEGHIRMRGADPKNLLAKKGYQVKSDDTFKGDIDLEALEKELRDNGENVPFVLMTVTCNGNGGQPVSMANIKTAASITHSHKKPFFFDAARFAENAYFIQQREPGYEHKSVQDIALEMFSYGEGCTMSAKKDGLVNIGGFLAFRDEEHYRNAVRWGIIFEGFATYGGMAGRDLEALARGLREVVDEDYLEDRTGQVRFLGDELVRAGVPIILPTGGHGIYVDAKQFYPHLPIEQFPAQCLGVELLIEGGVRGVELGACAFGYHDEKTGKDVWPELDLIRLAIPRRVYTDRHMMHVVRTFETLSEKKTSVTGLRLVYETQVMRHFTARFERL